MIIPDASVWVSYLSPQEVHYPASLRWFMEVVRNNTVIVAPAILLAEVAGAIARRAGSTELGHRAVNHVLSTPHLRIFHGDRELSTLAAQVAAEQFLRGADALYVALAHHLKIPLVTWDQEQLTRASAVVTAYMPSSEIS